MATAPPALLTLTQTFQSRADRPKSYVLGGIVGDAAHMNPPEGYHVSYNDLGGDASKYGLSFPGDYTAGKAQPTFASAWDLSMDEADMIAVTTRLINAAKAKDPRVSMCWEIAGTTNGTSVHAYYLNSDTDDPNNTQGWSSSHLHHVHISFKRADCDNYAALAPISDVICGVPLEEDMALTPEVQKAFTDLQNYIRSLFQVDANLDGKPDFTGTVERAVSAAIAPLKAEVDAIKKKVGA